MDLESWAGSIDFTTQAAHLVKDHTVPPGLQLMLSSNGFAPFLEGVSQLVAPAFQLHHGRRRAADAPPISFSLTWLSLP